MVTNVNYDKNLKCSFSLYHLIHVLVSVVLFQSRFLAVELSSDFINLINVVSV